MTEEEIRMRALELATRHVLSRGPASVSFDEVQKTANEIVAWVRQTPPTGEELRAYVDSRPEELVGLYDSLRGRFDLTGSDTAYVVACALTGVLECRKARN